MGLVYNTERSFMTHRIAPKYGLFIALFFIFSIIISLSVGKSLVWAIAITLLLALAILKANQVPMKESLAYIFENVRSAKNVYLLVLMIGMNVSMWIASGIVPSLIYYGFDVIQKVNFLPFAFVISAIMAFFLGTGLGTISTMGIALYTLGLALGLPAGLLMGALISGAYVADRLSPISALVNFTLETVGTTFKNAFNKTVKVMLPCMGIAFLFYWFKGRAYTNTITPSELAQYKEVLAIHFNISPYFFILPILVLWISFKGIGSSKVLGTGIFAGFLMALLFQGMSFGDGIVFLLSGFTQSSDIQLIKALEIGGALPMLEVVLVISGGIALSAIFEICHLTEPLESAIVNKSTSPRKAVLRTGLLSIFLNALTCDQTVGILLPGKYLKNAFYQNNQDASDLYQTIANSGTSIAPLMPWNVNAIIILAITGVSALSFAPYAILNWISFPMAILFSKKTT